MVVESTSPEELLSGLVAWLVQFWLGFFSELKMVVVGSVLLE